MISEPNVTWFHVSYLDGRCLVIDIIFLLMTRLDNHIYNTLSKVMIQIVRDWCPKVGVLIGYQVSFQHEQYK